MKQIFRRTRTMGGTHGLLGLVAAAAFALAHAAPGSLDPTFGTAGKQFTNFGQRADGRFTTDSAAAMTVQPDGGIVVVGLTDDGTTISGALARYLPDGTLDPAFGNGGLVMTPPPCSGCSGGGWRSVALQADGKIVVASDYGDVRTFGSTIVLGRYSTAGALDATFGAGGIVTVQPRERDYAGSVLVQPDGKIVLSVDIGERSATGARQLGLMRFRPDGSPDASFGTNGLALAEGVPFRVLTAPAVRQGDGRIVVGAAFTQGSGSVFGVVRFDANGAVEMSSAVDITPGLHDFPTALGLTPAGKIVLGGTSGIEAALVRLNADGSLDQAFGAGGRRSVPEALVNPIAGNAAITALVSQADGKLVAATIDGQVLRFDIDGSLDVTFGSGGRVRLVLSQYREHKPLAAIAVQADGRIVAAGDGNLPAREGDFALARIEPSRTAFLSPEEWIVFEPVTRGTASVPQAVTVTNTGAAARSITSIALQDSEGGGMAAHFSQANDCDAPLAPGASCSIAVVHAPPFPSSFTGAGMAQQDATLSVSVDGGASGFAVRLTGFAEHSLVPHFYRSILRRSVDWNGSAYWEAERARIEGLGARATELWFAMAMAFYASPEYVAFGRDPTAFVTDLYRTFFNRSPDGEGLAYWTAQMAAGMPPNIVLAAFMFSAEFAQFVRRLAPDAPVRAEIDMTTDFYRGLLARLPDTAGFEFFLQRLRTAQCQGAGAVLAEAASISSGFIDSAEYAARGRNNAQYVADLYNAFLRRAGDLQGVKYWIEQLDTGARSRANVLQAFVASDEFNARVRAVVAAGCQ